MSETKITDLVPQETIDKIKELNTEIQGVLTTYTNTAKEMAKGLDINVRVVGDIDRLEKQFVEKTKEAAVSAERLNSVMAEQRQVISDTTPVIARRLMEQERVNKSQREAYTEHDRVKKLLDQYHDTYENQLQSLAKLTRELEQNKKAQKDNEKALSMGKVSMEQYAAKQAELIGQHRALTQEKRTLSQIMTAEEKAMQSDETSYVHMSQQLELLRKAYSGLSEEGRSFDFGKELEAAIQNLDAHLKDVAADMGEFQRNVGNYAIAGQQGVVTTESVIAAISQEARTMQDLADQTKILEEAKLMLNKKDADYQSTLDSINAKLEENKRKLSDVSDILGKEARSVSEAEAQNKRLSEAIKQIDLTSADAKKKLEEMRAQIERNNRTIADATGANEKFADTVLSIIGVNTSLGSSFQSLGQNGNFLDGLNTKVKAFGKTLMGLLANPWVLAFLGIGGVIAGFKWWYDYNKGLVEASRLTQNFTGLTGDAADKITTDTQAIADHMGKSFDDTIGAANTLVQQFGISWEEALTKIEDGIQAGADMNGRFIENINQFAPALRDAGVSVDEFVSILAETRNGIFDEKGVQDIVKGGTHLRAMTQQVADSLDACGISSKQMQEDLKKGNITMLEAVQQVAAKLKELPENSQEAGQVMKNVFGRTAAEGGTLLIQSIADVNTNLDVAKERMGELGRLNREHIEAQKELNGTLAALFKMSGTSFEEMTVSAKTYIVQGLTGIIRKCVDVANWFIRIYNGSEQVRSKIEGIGIVFKTVWSVIKNVCIAMADEFAGIGKILEGVLTVKPELIKEGVDLVKDGYKNAALNIADDFVDAFKTGAENIRKGHLDEFDIRLNVENPESEKSGDGTADSDFSDFQSKETEKERKAREKAAKEELKRLNEIEESKIALMAEGHEKELAMIRLKFKKKIDEISGNGETEKALRVQLSEQCQKEVSDCELKYQAELSKINLANRLASVKKGSKEELDLKLAQLEAARAAELKAAEKTGADINFINAKFDKERLEMKEEYAAAAVQKIQQQYADEQAERDNAMMAELIELKKHYAEELELAGNNGEKRNELKERYENKSAEITEKYAIQSAKAAVAMLEKSLENENLSAEDREKIEQELAAAKIKLEQSVTDAVIAENDRKVKSDDDATNRRIGNAQKWLQVAADSLNAINGLASAVYDAKIERLEAEQEANTEAGEKEQERITELVNKKVITEEEGEARKRAAEAQTAKKNEELEKKKQQLKHKQAVWDKANSVAQAGIATALAIMNMMKSAPWPVNIAMAAIAGAMGAVQVATILATPIPKYAKGTDRHKGGPAIVGDGGVHEVVLFNGCAWLTPDRPTLVDIPAGAVVVPSVSDFDPADFDPRFIFPLDFEMPRPFRGGDNGHVVVNNDYSRLERGISELANLIRRQTRQQHVDSRNADYELFKLRI